MLKFTLKVVRFKNVLLFFISLYHNNKQIEIMTTLRNEILPVKELAKRFVVNEHKLIQCSTSSKNTIEKTVITKLGFSKVVGMKLQDVKNPRFDAKRVGEVNPISKCKYQETEYITETTWLFE